MKCGSKGAFLFWINKQRNKMCWYILSKYVVRLWILASFVVFYVGLCCLSPNLIGKSWQCLIKAKTGRLEKNVIIIIQKQVAVSWSFRYSSLNFSVAFLNFLTASLIICTHVVNTWSCVLITYTKCTYVCVFLCFYSSCDGHVFKNALKQTFRVALVL